MRLESRWQLNTWEGELHSWKRQQSSGMVETISYSRSPLERDEGEPYVVSLMIEVAGGAAGYRGAGQR